MRKSLRLAILAALAAAVLPFAAPAAQIEVNPPIVVHMPSEPSAAMLQARGFVAEGNLGKAIRLLALYVAAHPDQSGPARLLGDLYYRQGDFPHAEAAYKAILARHPNDRETHNRLGSVYATENRIDAAIREFDLSLPGTDSVPDLVHLHERKGDLAEYVFEAKREAAADPADPNAQIQLAQVYRALYRPDLAIVYFKRAMDNAPNSLLALNGLGLSYLDEMEYAKAVGYFKRCRAQAPRGYSCIVNLGAAYLEENRLDKAEAALVAAHDLRPERPEALVNFGYLADSRGDWRRAIRYYVEALTVYPYSVDAYIDLGWEYQQHKLYALAESALLKGLAVAPDDGRLHFLLGQAYADQGKVALALSEFKAATSSADPDVRRIAQARLARMQPLPAKKP